MAEPARGLLFALSALVVRVSSCTRSMADCGILEVLVLGEFADAFATGL